MVSPAASVECVVSGALTAKGVAVTGAALDAGGALVEAAATPCAKAGAEDVSERANAQRELWTRWRRGCGGM
jgi:hypothetical protein